MLWKLAESHPLGNGLSWWESQKLMKTRLAMMWFVCAGGTGRTHSGMIHFYLYTQCEGVGMRAWLKIYAANQNRDESERMPKRLEDMWRLAELIVDKVKLLRNHISRKDLTQHVEGGIWISRFFIIIWFVIINLMNNYQDNDYFMKMSWAFIIIIIPNIIHFYIISQI